MRSSHTRLATTIIAGLFVMSACGSAATPAPVVTATPAKSSATSTPTPAPATTPTPTPAPAPVTSPTQAAAAPALTTWRRVDGTPNAHAVTSTGSGWVGVGSVRVAQRMPAAWTSPDGVSWTQASIVPLPEGAQYGEMFAVTGGPQGLVAIGSEGRSDGREHGVVWRSRDGEAWEIIGSGDLFDLGECIEGCGSLTSVAAGPAGIVVTGGDILFSPDGGAWTRLQLPTPKARPAAHAFPVAAAATGSGFVAIGRLDGGYTWSSPDGRTWSRPVKLPGGPEAYPSAIAVGLGLTVIVGGRCDQDDCVGLAWAQGTDGEWTSTELDTPPPFLLALSGSSFVGLGRDAGELFLLISQDGLVWDKLVLPSDAFPPQTEYLTLDIAGAPGSVIMVGELDGPSGSRGIVRVSP